MEERRREGSPAPVRVEQTEWKCPVCGAAFDDRRQCGKHLKWQHVDHVDIEQMRLEIPLRKGGAFHTETVIGTPPDKAPKTMGIDVTVFGNGRVFHSYLDASYVKPSSKEALERVRARARKALLKAGSRLAEHMSTACDGVRLRYDIQ